MFYLLPARAWELLVGAMLAGFAAMAAAEFQRSRVMGEVMGVMGVAMLLLAILGFHDGVPVPGWFALLPVLATVALMIAGADPRTMTSRFLQSAPLVHIGRWSYPMYLVHWPLHVFAKHELGERYGLGWRLAMFAVSIATAWAIFRWVETPIRDRRWLSSGRHLIAVYGAVVLMTAVASIGVVSTQGWPQRLPAQAVKLERAMLDRSPPLDACRYEPRRTWPPDRACRLGASDAEPSWVVFGDSHAWAGHASFDRWLAQRGESGWLVFNHECPPLSGVHLSGDQIDLCKRFNDATYAWIERSTQLNNVLLVSAWRQVEEGLLASSVTQAFDAERSRALFDQSFRASLLRLSTHGKRAHVWGPVPGARTDVPQSLARAAWRGNAADVRWTTAEHRAQFAFLYDAVQRERGLITSFVDSSLALCASGRCEVAHDGEPLYFDNAHVSASTAAHWAKVLAQVPKP